MSKFKTAAAEVAALVEEKNIAYGDSFNKAGEILKVLYPEGVKPEQYGDFLAMVRIIDKQFRIATQKDAFGEDPWRDILGYALNAVVRNTTPAVPDNEVTMYRVRQPGAISWFEYIMEDDKSGKRWWASEQESTLYTKEAAVEVIRDLEKNRGYENLVAVPVTK
jgi:hypothetical protein